MTFSFLLNRPSRRVASLTILALASALGACAGEQGESQAENATARSGDAAMIKLATSHECMACHAVENRVVGPAFRDIATSYPNNKTIEERLTDSVINGSRDVWGAVPMPANDTISPDVARELVTWILALPPKKGAESSDAIPTTEDGLLALSKSQNCVVCHARDKTIVGPAYRLIAERYAGDEQAEDLLTAKVLNGGRGVWSSVPMPPNTQTTPEKARALVAWILAMR